MTLPAPWTPGRKMGGMMSEQFDTADVVMLVLGFILAVVSFLWCVEQEQRIDRIEQRMPERSEGSTERVAPGLEEEGKP